jgi:DNA polymerase-3 subunit gamma/tau
MALIKLTFLYQAIEISDSTSKKKLDGVKAVSFRAIPIIAYKPKNTEENKSVKAGEASLYVEQAAQTNARQSLAQEKQSPQLSSNPSALVPEGGMSLANIRKMVASQQKQPDAQVLLTSDSLQMAWQLYIEKLVNNPSACNNFKLARLQVVDLEQFDVYTDTVIQQKFIEMERGPLIEHIHNFFKNRQIKYNVVLEEQIEDAEPKERPLSAREQYLKIIEMYPLVKEFKDKMGLDLDY